MKQKPIARRLIDGIDAVINFILLTVFLLIFVFAAYVQWDSHQLTGEASASTFSAYKPTEEDHYNFDQLQKRNPDVFGWLTLDDTPVDYPLVQGEDNSKYINTAVTGEFSLAGTIFLDYRNDRNLTDVCSILYGHHMAEDAMFGSFDHFETEEYFDSHRNGTLYYHNQYHTLNVFAFLRADGYDTKIYAPGTGKKQKDAYLATLQETTVIYREDFDTSLPILLMSTCESGETNGRMLLAATIGGGRTVGSNTISVEKHFPWWILWILLLLLMLGLLLYLLRRRQKKAEAKRDKAREHAWSISADGKSLQINRHVLETTGTREESEMAKTESPKQSDKQPEKKKTQPSILSDLLSLIIKLAFIGLVFLVLFTFVFGLHIPSGTEMDPSVKDRDVVVYYRLDKTADARELIAYETPDGDIKVGRIVAMPGDSVDVTNEGLKINGYAQNESYVTGETLAYENSVEYPIAVNADEYFVLGDNRLASEDSRVYGTIAKDQIKGRVITIIRRRDF